MATGLKATLSPFPGPSRRAMTTQREGLDTFEPGDEITIVVTTSTPFSPNTLDINAAVLIAE
jgi:hypothetical protein